jgi:superfamily II DNA or RNA helicase
MQLRQWQLDCVSRIYEQFTSNNNHFLCLATPGSGKTFMASSIAKKLLDEGMIDIVVCFSPSSIVAEDFGSTVSSVLERSMSGLINSVGASYTYQKMLTLDDEFWKIFQNKVLVVFDEIHHCASDGSVLGNAWGNTIVQKIQNRASYTLALSGTPWRTDAIPIALSNYCENGTITCDFTYGLNQAIKDEVCRTPSFISIDAQSITYSQEKFDSLTSFLDRHPGAFQNVLESEYVIEFAIQQAEKELCEFRKLHPEAACLIVASSVVHARLIQQTLGKKFGKKSDVVSYEERSSKAIIRNFRNSSTEFIISIGMISEGTNIPRLRVCCFLSQVKTEMYFRQVLGRVLRYQNLKDPTGVMIYLDCNTTPTYVERICSDIPEKLEKKDAILDSKFDLTHRSGKATDENDECKVRISLPNKPEESWGENTTSDCSRTLDFEDDLAPLFCIDSLKARVISHYELNF